MRTDYNEFGGFRSTLPGPGQITDVCSKIRMFILKYNVLTSLIHKAI